MAYDEFLSGSSIEPDYPKIHGQQSQVNVIDAVVATARGLVEV